MDLEESEYNQTDIKYGAFSRRIAENHKNFSQDNRWPARDSDHSTPEQNVQTLSVSRITTGRSKYAVTQEGWSLP